MVSVLETRPAMLRSGLRSRDTAMAAMVGLLSGQAARGGGEAELVAAGVQFDHLAADAALQLRGAAGRDRAAVVDDHDPAGELVCLVEVLGGEQHVGAG